MLTDCKEIFMLSKTKTKKKSETKSEKLVNSKLHERETNNRT